MRIEVRRHDAEGSRALDLRAYLRLCFPHVHTRGGLVFQRVEVAVFVEQRRHALLRQHGTPAVEGPLARQRQMEPQVRARVLARVGGYLREPGARTMISRRDQPRSPAPSSRPRTECAMPKSSAVTIKSLASAG